jgi:hypothetical protein
MNGTAPAFASLAELLESTKGKSVAAVCETASREFAAVSRQLEEIQREEKKRAPRPDPQLLDYVQGLKFLLFYLDSPVEFERLPDGSAKRQIESASTRWNRR